MRYPHILALISLIFLCPLVFTPPSRSWQKYTGHPSFYAPHPSNLRSSPPLLEANEILYAPGHYYEETRYLKLLVQFFYLFDAKQLIYSTPIHLPSECNLLKANSKTDFPVKCFLLNQTTVSIISCMFFFWFWNHEKAILQSSVNRWKTNQTFFWQSRLCCLCFRAVFYAPLHFLSNPPLLGQKTMP